MKRTRQKSLQPGTRIRTKVPGFFGTPRGSTGTVLYDRLGLVHFLIDGEERWTGSGDYMRYQIAIMRDQKPNPKHTSFVHAAFELRA